MSCSQQSLARKRRDTIASMNILSSKRNLFIIQSPLDLESQRHGWILALGNREGDGPIGRALLQALLERRLILNVLLLFRENFGCTRVLPFFSSSLYLLHIHILTACAALVEQFKKKRAENNARKALNDCMGVFLYCVHGPGGLASYYRIPLISKAIPKPPPKGPRTSSLILMALIQGILLLLPVVCDTCKQCNPEREACK